MADNSKERDRKEYKHHDFEVDHVNPDEIDIDEVNERDQSPGPRTATGDLEESIEEDGIENPPQVRPTEDGEGYRVFAGQRRVLAAQTVGLEEIPVIVKQLNDMEALAASVNENNEHLKKDVARKDRATAVKRLLEKWDIERVSDHFGVSQQTIRGWLEPNKDFWADTIFDPSEETELNTEYIADDVLADIRRVTGDSDLAEEISKKIIENQVPRKVIRSALDIADDPPDLWQEIKDQWEALAKNQTRVSPQFTLTGDSADKLKEEAKKRGINEKQAARKLLEERLDQLKDGSSIGQVSIEESQLDLIQEIGNRNDMKEEEIIHKVIERWLDYRRTGTDILSVTDE